MVLLSHVQNNSIIRVINNNSTLVIVTSSDWAIEKETEIYSENHD